MLRAALLGIAALVALATPTSAEMPDPAEVFLSGRISVGGSYLLNTGNALAKGRSDHLDYAVFVRELLAFIAKEILPDAEDEYAGGSEIPSRLSASMPHQRSQFGEHCLIVLAEIGSHVSPFPSGSFSDLSTSPSLLAYLARAGSTVLMVERLWSAVRNDVEQRRPSGFSLDPKVGTNKVGAYLTFRW
ncbi:MAG: hypothetical protein ACREQ9_15095 [Candidatus Binatia bacterium]